MSVRLINKTYGLEPPVNVTVLKDWRGWKEGDTFVATTQKELRGAILQDNAGNLDVEGYSQELVAEYTAREKALAKGFPTGPEVEPKVMTYKDRPGAAGKNEAETVEQLKAAGFEDAQPEEAPAEPAAMTTKRKRKAKE